MIELVFGLLFSAPLVIDDELTERPLQPHLERLDSPPEALRIKPTVVMHRVGRGPQLEGIRVAARLTKPIKQEALRRALNAALEGSSEAVVLDEPRTEDSQVKLRILMAEDNLVNQKVALKILERLGHTANVVANGQEALDALSQAPYDIVLMDVHMPVMDGLEATRRILAQLPPEARPHIIALTASARAEDRQLCEEAGMSDFLTKPIRLQDLAEAFARYAQASYQTRTN